MIRAIVIAGVLALAFFALVMSRPMASAACLRGVLYEDAILHAGSTDYVFSLDNDISLTLRVPNGESASAGADALMMMQSDGPAEASDVRLGRAHDLCYSDGDIRVSLSDGEETE